MARSHRYFALTLLAGGTLVGVLSAGGQTRRQALPTRPTPNQLPAEFPPFSENLTSTPINRLGGTQDGKKVEPSKQPDKDDPKPTKGEGGRRAEGGGDELPPADIIASLNQKIEIRPDNLEGAIDPTAVVIDRPDLFLPVPVPGMKDVTRPFALTPNGMTLRGVRLGRTKIRVFDPKNPKSPPYSITVQIVPDIDYLNRLVRARFPMGNLLVTAAADDFLFVDGYVDNPADVEAVEQLLNRFFKGVVNNVRVAGAMQVQLEVVIARVDRTQLRQLGVNFLLNNQQAYVGTQFPNLINPPSVTLPTGGSKIFSPIGPTGSAPLTTAATAFFGVSNESGAIYGFIEALVEKNVAKVLANPTLVTFNGRQADFLVGGEQPVPVPQALGTPGVTFKQFGTRLNFIPTILGGGKIRLDVSPEVSTLNTNISVSGVPQFVVQRLHATVELQSGQTLCLGGLLQSESEAQTQKIPVLGSLPYVGAAFRRVRHRVVERELLILVTPRIFNPLEGCQVPQSLPGQATVAPTDGQLYGKAVLEAYPGSAKHALRHEPQLGDNITRNQPVIGTGAYDTLQQMVIPSNESGKPSNPTLPPALPQP